MRYVGLATANFRGWVGSVANTFGFVLDGEGSVGDGGVWGHRNLPASFSGGDFIGCGYHWDYGVAFWTKNRQVIACLSIPAEVAGRLCPSIAVLEVVDMNTGGLHSDSPFEFELSSFDLRFQEFASQFNERIAKQRGELQRALHIDPHIVYEEDDIPTEYFIRNDRIGEPIELANMVLKNLSFSERMSQLNLEPFYTSAEQFAQDPHLAQLYGIECPCFWMGREPELGNMCQECFLGVQVHVYTEARQVSFLQYESVHDVDDYALSFGAELGLPPNADVHAKADAILNYAGQARTMARWSRLSRYLEVIVGMASGYVTQTIRSMPI